MADNQLELREATKNLRLATEELQRFNQSAGYEIAKIVGKDVGSVAEKFTAGFMQVPGVQTLGSIGTTLFNKAFQSIKQKRELKALAERIGLNKQEVDALIRQKKVADAQAKANEELKSGAEQFFGMSVKIEDKFESVLGDFDMRTRRFMKVQEDGSVRMTGGVGKLVDEQRQAIEKGETRTAEELDLSRRILTVQDENFKFSKENRKLFEATNHHLQTSNDSIGELVENQQALQLQDLKGKGKQKEIANEQARADVRQENVFKKIAGNLGFLKDSAKEGDGEKKGFFGSLISKIGSFATTIMGLPAMFVALKASLVAFGAALAPLAVPIAIGAAALLGFVAFIKGFIEGFGEDGFFGGVKEGLMEVFDWFVGFPLRLLKNLTVFVLELLGFDELAKTIDTAFDPFLDALRGIFGILTDVLITPIVTVGRTITNIFFGLIEIIKAPFEGLFVAIESAFGGINSIIDGIGMIFSGDILGGLTTIFDGLTNILLAPLKGVYTFITELFGGILDILIAPFKAIYDTMSDLFFGETSHIASVVSWIAETFGGFFDFITKPFQGLYDLVVGIFTFDLDQIGSGIFKLIGGIFDIITYPFRSIFNLISSIFDFDFLGYLETLPGVKQVMGIIRKVGGFFTTEEEEDEAREQRDAAAKSASRAKKNLKKAQRLEDSARFGSLTINGRAVTAEERAEIVERQEDRRIGAEIDYSASLQDLDEAQKRYEEIMNKTTLPELVTLAGDKMQSALFGSNQKTIEKIEEQKEAALAKQEKAFQKMANMGFGKSNEEIEKKMQEIRDEYDKQINAEMDKGYGVINSALDFIGGLFDFDFMGMVKSIPGAEKVLNFLGFGDSGSKDIAQQIADQEKLVADLQEDVANDRFYESKGQRERDKLALVEAMKELEDLRAAGQAVTVVNNNNVVNANTNTQNNQTTSVPIRDTAPPMGTLSAAYADF